MKDRVLWGYIRMAASRINPGAGALRFEMGTEKYRQRISWFSYISSSLQKGQQQVIQSNEKFSKLIPPLQNLLKTTGWYFLLLFADFVNWYETNFNQTDTGLSVTSTETCSGANKQRSFSEDRTSRAFCMSNRPQT